MFDVLVIREEELYVISELSLARVHLEGTSMIPAVVVDEINDFLIYLLLGYDVPSETRGEHASCVGIRCDGTPLKHNYFICILIDREVRILLLIRGVRVVSRGH